MSHRLEYDWDGELLIYCSRTNLPDFVWTVTGFLDEDARFCPGCGSSLAGFKPTTWKTAEQRANDNERVSVIRHIQRKAVDEGGPKDA